MNLFKPFLKIQLTERAAIAGLTVLYLLVSLYLYSKYGVKTLSDAPRYLNYADNLSQRGIYFDPLNFWYISYVFFVYFSQLIDDSVLDHYSKSIYTWFCSYHCVILRREKAYRKLEKSTFSRHDLYLFPG